MKYFIKDSDQEVKFGQTITVEQEVDTSLGRGICKTDVKVTSANINMLVEQGFLVQKDEKKEEGGLTKEQLEHWHNLKPFIRRLARKNSIPLPVALIVLNEIQQLSSRAMVDVLLETIAEVLNRGKDTSRGGWFLDLANDYKIAQLIGAGTCLIKFADKNDAKYAYQLIKPFISEIMNGQ